MRVSLTIWIVYLAVCFIAICTTSPGTAVRIIGWGFVAMCLAFLA